MQSSDPNSTDKVHHRATPPQSDNRIAPPPMASMHPNAMDARRKDHPNQPKTSQPYIYRQYPWPSNPNNTHSYSVGYHWHTPSSYEWRHPLTTFPSAAGNSSQHRSYGYIVRDKPCHTETVSDTKGNDADSTLIPNNYDSKETKAKTGVHALLSAISMITSPNLVQESKKKAVHIHKEKDSTASAPQMHHREKQDDLISPRMNSSHSHNKPLRDISNQIHPSSHAARMEKGLDAVRQDVVRVENSWPTEPSCIHSPLSTHAARMESAIKATNVISRNPDKLQGNPVDSIFEKRLADSIVSEREVKKPCVDLVGLNLLYEASSLLIHDTKKQPSSLDASTYDVSSESKRKSVISSKKSNGCQCPKSNCIKLYCECFASSNFCSSSCKCRKCKNTPNHNGGSGERTMAIQSILARNPHSFRKDKSELNKKFAEATTVTCRCVKSRCLKLYCDCFQSSVVCNDSCLCVKCLNTEEESGDRGERTMARNICLLKRADAFEFKEKESGTGCKCKTNRCLKKYCDCFSNGISCSEDNCICRNCENNKQPALYVPNKTVQGCIAV